MDVQASDASLIAAGNNEANLHLFRPEANKVNGSIRLDNTMMGGRASI